MKAILIMGSTSDEHHAKKITDKLDEYGISWEQHAASAHKQPLKVLEILNDNKDTNKADQKNSKSKRSIFALNNIKKSEKISEKNIISLRPKIGIGAKYYYC